MKKSNVLVLSILVALVSWVVVSCEREESNSVKSELFYEAGSGSSFNLMDQAALNRLAIVLARESAEIKIVKDAEVVFLSDKQGAFRAISVVYQVGDLITKMTIPISEVSSDKIGINARTAENTSYYMAEACEMKCTTAWPCSSCTQEIIERCKSQTCSCNGNSNGCTASIVFPE
jgi:hypothetical protein